MTPEYEVTDCTRGWRQRSGDLALILAFHVLWLSWGHVVTLSRLDGSGSQAPMSNPTLSPRD